MQLSIVTPEKELFNGEITLIQLPGVNGLFEILKNHAPIISLLGKGKIKIIDKENKNHFFNISNGMVECNQNNIIVLIESEK